MFGESYLVKDSWNSKILEFFVPTAIEIRSGATVIWKNNKYQFVEAEASIFSPYRSANIPVRRPDKIGNFLLVLGIISLIIWGLGFFDIYHVIKE